MTINTLTEGSFTLLPADINGNPRLGIHFMDLLTEAEMTAIKENNKQRLDSGQMIPLDQSLKDMQKLAIKKGKAVGNCTAYRGKEYGGFLALSEGAARALINNQII